MSCLARHFRFWVAAAALSACGRAPRPGDVPKVRLGADACARCGMIVSEERFVSGYVDSAGRSVIFDDVGEFLRAADVQPGLKERSFVHDAVDGSWLPASKAVYRRIPGLPTPMGSGVAAFRDAGQAAALEARLAGKAASRP